MPAQRGFTPVLVLASALFSPALLAAVVHIELTTQPGGKLVADAVITLVPVGKTIPPKPQRISIDQVDREFVPRVSVTSTGSSVVFPNKDNIRHQVYSFSPPKKFELKLYAGTPAAPVVFDKPGLVVLGCNIHDWMLSYLVVTDAPYYGKSEAAGKIDLKDIPPGDYDYSVWHPDSQAEKTGKLTVAEPAASLKLALDLSKATAQ